MARANGHTGFAWREQITQSARAWADRAKNKETISALRVVSTGPDAATQIAAVDNGHFETSTGSIHAILGETGAGRSTLMKLRGGVGHPEEARVLLEGQGFEMSVRG